jgi:hypothetical protein
MLSSDLFVVWLPMCLLLVIPFWIICGKVGLPRILSLATLVPFVGVLIVLIVLAFARWPNRQGREI